MFLHCTALLMEIIYLLYQLYLAPPCHDLLSFFFYPKHNFYNVMGKATFFFLGTFLYYSINWKI